MAVSTHRRTVEFVHVVMESPKSLDEVRRAFEARVPPLDREIPDLMQAVPTDRLLQRLKAAPDLSIFLCRDHGRLLRLYGEERRAVQYEIGNPLTASSMTRYQLAAGLYAPLRIILYEDEGATVIEYDLPSSLFGQFGDDRVNAVGRQLDIDLLCALADAAE
jgi:hypothetical protein